MTYKDNTCQFSRKIHIQGTAHNTFFQYVISDKLFMLKKIYYVRSAFW